MKNKHLDSDELYLFYVELCHKIQKLVEDEIGDLMASDQNEIRELLCEQFRFDAG